MIDTLITKQGTILDLTRCFSAEKYAIYRLGEMRVLLLQAIKKKKYCFYRIIKIQAIKSTAQPL